MLKTDSIKSGEVYMSLYAQLKATVLYAAVCFYWNKKEQERMMYEIDTDATEEQLESLLPAACSGYVRMLREDDIYPDSSAQPRAQDGLDILMAMEMLFFGKSIVKHLLFWHNTMVSALSRSLKR